MKAQVPHRKKLLIRTFAMTWREVSLCLLYVTFASSLFAINTLSNEPTGDVSSVTSSTGPSDWVTFQGNYLHTGYNDEDQISLPITRSWWRKVYTGRLQPVTVIGNRLLVSTYLIDHYIDTQAVKCMDVRTGFYLWQHIHGSWAYAEDISQVSYSDDHLYYQVSNGPKSYLRKCNLNTGDIVWDAPFMAQIAEFLAPAVVSGKVVISGGYYGGMYSFEAATGDFSWFQGMGPWDLWAATIYEDTVYTFVAGILRVFDLHSGEWLWTLRPAEDTLRSYVLASSIRTAPALDTTKRILYCNDGLGLHAVDLNSKEFLWHRWTTPGWKGWGISPAIHDGIVYAVDSGRLVALDGLTGEESWRVEGDTVFFYHPVGANGLIFVSSFSQTVAVDLTQGEKVWSCDVGGQLSIANNTLYIADTSGTVHLYIGAPVETGVDPSPELPDDQTLDQNYPNPFNPSTSIDFTLPTRSHVLLKIYDVLGREVITLVNQQMPVGLHTITWDGTDFTGEPVATGIYFYRLTTDGHSESKKMLLLK